jgi:hypothetical protein
VPINSVPVDQSAFSRMMVVSIEPRMAFEFDQVTRKRRDTGIQATSSDGLEKKWTVQVVISMPSRFDSRTQSEVVPVTVTCAEDPSAQVMEGDRAWFDNLTVGVMNPEQDPESGRITGGRLFWQATAVRAQSNATVKS